MQNSNSVAYPALAIYNSCWQQQRIAVRSAFSATSGLLVLHIRFRFGNWAWRRPRVRFTWIWLVMPVLQPSVTQRNATQPLVECKSSSDWSSSSPRFVKKSRFHLLAERRKKPQAPLRCLLLRKKVGNAFLLPKKNVALRYVKLLYGVLENCQHFDGAICPWSRLVGTRRLTVDAGNVTGRPSMFFFRFLFSFFFFIRIECQQYIYSYGRPA